MKEKLKELKEQLSAEWNRPKAKNVGNREGVAPRDPEKIRTLHAEIRETKLDIGRPRKATAKRDSRTPAWHAEKKAKSYNRRGRVLSYITRWMR
jgi:hypothetical protein